MLHNYRVSLPIRTDPAASSKVVPDTHSSAEAWRRELRSRFHQVSGAQVGSGQRLNCVEPEMQQSLSESSCRDPDKEAAGSLSAQRFRSHPLTWVSPSFPLHTVGRLCVLFLCPCTDISFSWAFSYRYIDSVDDSCPMALQPCVTFPHTQVPLTATSIPSHPLNLLELSIGP